MWWLVIAFICGGIAGTIASTKGRSQFGWFFLAFLIGPFVFLVAVLPPIANGKTTKKCPFCSEIIKYNARICKYCTSPLELLPPKPPTGKVAACPNCGNTNLRYTILDGGKSGLECPVCKH